MPSLDPYSMTDKLDETTISAITTRLEARGELPFFRKMLDEYLDALNPSELNRVLEVGCGTGVAARALAQHPQFSGHIDASDLSGDLVAAAEKLTQEAGCADKITYSVADAQTLSNAEPYDAVIAHTVISHVPDYKAFFSSLCRAVAPTGKVVLFDGDFSSITLGAENPEDGEALSNALIAGLITNPTIMRQVPWLASANGFEIVQSFANLLSEIGTAGFFADGFPSYPILLPKTGVADEATVQAWVDQQIAYSEAGTFFGAINFYTYILQSKKRS